MGKKQKHKKGDVVILDNGAKVTLISFDGLEREWMARAINGGIFFITEKQIKQVVFPVDTMNAPE